MNEDDDKKPSPSESIPQMYVCPQCCAAKVGRPYQTCESCKRANDYEDRYLM